MFEEVELRGVSLTSCFLQTQERSHQATARRTGEGEECATHVELLCRALQLQLDATVLALVLRKLVSENLILQRNTITLYVL